MEENDDGESEAIPELDEHRKPNVETRSFLPTVELNADATKPMLEQMNKKQQEIFYSVRRWCIEKSCGKNPDPFYLFLTGGAGVGKSHTIKCINYEASRLLRDTSAPGKQKVLLTAPTGVAAFYINGSTLHHSFMLPLKQKIPVQSLADQSLQAMRAHRNCHY